jgi:acetylglutamate kinase
VTRTSIRVIKVGGRPQSDPTLAERVARAAAGNPTIVVHGGGDEVTALQAAMGIVPQFVDGRRVTTAADIDLVRMALSGSANKRLVAALNARGATAIGLSGEDGALLTAAPCDPARLGHVGTPDRVNVALFSMLLSAGYLPVISPISASTDLSLGSALNVNGDDAAAAIAAAMQANELLLISDVEGVLLDGAVVTELRAGDVRSMLAGNAVTGGMRAKLQAALVAVNGGVERVRISDLLAIDDVGRGTLIVSAGGIS